MSIIRVPVNVRSLTLNINGTRTASVWTESFFNGVFNITRDIWLPAQIRFEVASFTPNVEAELLNPTSTSRVNGSDQPYLCRLFQATTGVSLLLVNEATSRDPAASGVGGSSVAAFRTCLLAHNSNQRTVGVYLAHEFGHLLGLHDIYTGIGDNLMFGALSTGENRLNREQRRLALRTARLLTQPTNSPTPQP